MLALAACGEAHPGADEAAVEGGAEVDAADADQASEAILSPADLQTLTVPAGEGSFPHGSHGEIACAQCHTAVKGHDTHAQVDCAECHQGSEWLGARVVFASEECMACHHAPEQAYGCERCHETADRAAPVEMIQDFRLSMRLDSRARALSFEHAVHTELECGSCHGISPSYAFSTSCSACHAEHHQPETNCLTCHSGLPLDTHALESHEGCGGSGCHTDRVTAALPPVRSVCLSCHEEQVEHEPAGQCADCHLVGWGGGG